MKKIFIVHGFGGEPNGNWKPWLMAELMNLGVYACALAMPNPKNPICNGWIEEISRAVESSKRDQVYLVGHSLGSVAILRFLEITKAKNIKGAVFISSPIYKTTKAKVATFLKKPFDFKTIKKNAKKTLVIHGDNDRNVSVEQGVFLAEQLKSEILIIPKGGHLGGSDGYFTFPQLLEELTRVMK